MYRAGAMCRAKAAVESEGLLVRRPAQSVASCISGLCCELYYLVLVVYVVFGLTLFLTTELFGFSKKFK